MNNVTLWDHIFFVIIGLILPGLSLLRGKVDMEEMNLHIRDKKRFYYLNGGVLWIGVALVVILWLIAGRPFETLGVRWPEMSILVWGLVSLFVFSYLAETFGEWNSKDDKRELLDAAPFLPANANEMLHFAFLALSAGICEEVVYRGFLVNYLFSSFDDKIIAFNVAVIFPAVIFGLVHMYQGMKSVLKISIMSLLFGTIFIFSRSLLIVVVLHSAVDLIGGLLGWIVARIYKNEGHFWEEEE